MRLNRVYDFQRAACKDPELITTWFKLVNNIKTEYGIMNNNFYKFYKTGFIMGVTYALLVVTSVIE